MNTKILEELGLTKTEITIYLALLRIGRSTTTPLVRDAGIHASKVYEYLDKLIQKGLVSYVIEANKKRFTAAEPRILKELLREKKQKLQEQEKEVDAIIPSLLAIQKQRKNVIKAEVYQGLKGIKSVYEKILTTLNRGETQYVIGAPRIANDLFEGYLLDWHKRRLKKGIRCKYIYDANVRDYGKIREKMKYTKVRYLSNTVISPVWIEIFKDHIVTSHIKGYDAVIVVLQDKEIAKTYVDYFKLIWKISKK